MSKKDNEKIIQEIIDGKTNFPDGSINNNIIYKLMHLEDGSKNNLHQ